MTDNLWIKSSASANGGECVEMQRTDESIVVRNSKDPDGPTLHYTPAEFAAWLEGAKNGEFDHLSI